MNHQKTQMEEAAVLYYEKNHTQQEIAELMNLSRQTISKLLNDAVKENIVEIVIHNNENDCIELENKICDIFKIKNAVVCSVSNKNSSIRKLMTAKRAAAYVLPLLERGNLNIAVSWGRTIQMFIDEFEKVNTSNNVVFPLLGATDQEQTYFLSNELARSFADKIGAKVKYAWFPYRPDCMDDCALFKKTSYYKKIYDLWSDIDIALVGIGNDDIIRTFGKAFGYREKSMAVVGDVSTHFFNENGEFIELYENTLCASEEHLKNARKTIAVVCGDDKAEAVMGALRTQIVDTLITDEYTARKIIDMQKILI